MLTLPAKLRTQRVGGPQTSTRPPAARAISAVRTSTHSDRAAAMSCQSHQAPRAWVSVAITAKARLACSIQTYARDGSRLTDLSRPGGLLHCSEAAAIHALQSGPPPVQSGRPEPRPNERESDDACCREVRSSP